ncbi:5'-nucleotidase C-terminal domain-containing protein [Sphingobacterium thalpophilum]|uniref:5'-nucleotidase C-terminal domain-containing protein n=1 Tax=Sphingobacterium thalpophilum TaxID=259 RepID=UPI0037D9B504
MNLSKQIAFIGSIGIISVLMASSCSKQLYPTQKDFRQYSINSEVQADPTVVSIYEPFKQKMEAEMNRVIGHAGKGLTKDKTPETLMGNFFCEALLWMSDHFAHNPADLAFATKGGIRNDLKAGDITVGHIFEVMPFENTLTVIELKGSQIRQLADYIAKTHGQPIAGMTLMISANGAQDIKIKGQPIDDNKLYKLVTYDYLANGGDNLTLLTQSVSRINYPQRMREGLIEYVSQLTKEGKEVNAVLDGRIKIN